jgi:hypothetical protein
LKKRHPLQTGLAEGLEKVREAKRTWTIPLLNQGILTPALIAKGLAVPISFVLKIQKELEDNESTPSV